MRIKLHDLIDELDDDLLQPVLHKAIDTLPDEAVPRVLKRLLHKRRVLRTGRSGDVDRIQAPD